jgi:hypothetical protein
MSMRGVTKPGALTVTTQFRGLFKDDPNEQVRFITSVRAGQSYVFVDFCVGIMRGRSRRRRRR